MVGIMKNLNIAVIGGGFMCKAHVNAYRTARYIFSDLGVRADLAAVCVRRQEQALALAQKYEFARAYTDLELLLQDESIDIYDICVPAQTHTEIALRLLKTGKTVLCEKPLALYAEDAKQMLLAADAYRAAGYTCFNYRFFPAVLLARRMLMEQELGSIRHMRVSYFQQNGADEERCFDTLRYACTQDCGSLQEIGTHAIDQMRFLAGELESVSAITKTFVPYRKDTGGSLHTVENEDMGAALVRFATGATGVLECSGAYWGRKNRLAWEIYCSEGSLFWSLEEPNFLGICRKGSTVETDGICKVNVTGGTYPYSEYWWPGAHNLGWEHGQINMIAAVLQNTAEKKQVQPAATFRDGYLTAVIVEAIRTSARLGRQVLLTPLFEDQTETEQISVQK